MGNNDIVNRLADNTSERGIFFNSGAQTSITSELFFAMQEGNTELALHSVERRIEAGIPDYLGNILQGWKYYLVHVLTVLGERVIRVKSSDDQIDRLGVSFLTRIDKAKSLEECHDLYREMARTLCAYNQKAKNRYPALVQRVMECVAMDLRQPLTLQYFASLLGVNGSYLSNLFHKHTGVTITEYVTKNRIDRAGQMLAYTQDAVKAIAESVGIPDVQYFSRLFKKQMGRTPTQYRESCGSECFKDRKDTFWDKA